MEMETHASSFLQKCAYFDLINTEPTNNGVYRGSSAQVGNRIMNIRGYYVNHRTITPYLIKAALGGWAGTKYKCFGYYHNLFCGD